MFALLLRLHNGFFLNLPPIAIEAASLKERLAGSSKGPQCGLDEGEGMQEWKSKAMHNLTVRQVCKSETKSFLSAINATSLCTCCQENQIKVVIFVVMK